MPAKEKHLYSIELLHLELYLEVLNAVLQSTLVFQPIGSTAGRAALSCFGDGCGTSKLTYLWDAELANHQPITSQ